MTCCFFNLHKQENSPNLEKHFDKEIEIAIGRGCSIFVCGKKYPEDEIFAERVMEAAKHYADDEISLVRMAEEDDDKLKKMFIDIADWEIYSYETV